MERATISGGFVSDSSASLVEAGASSDLAQKRTVGVPIAALNADTIVGRVLPLQGGSRAVEFSVHTKDGSRGTEADPQSLINWSFEGRGLSIGVNDCQAQGVLARCIIKGVQKNYLEEARITARVQVQNPGTNADEGPVTKSLSGELGLSRWRRLPIPARFAATLSGANEIGFSISVDNTSKNKDLIIHGGLKPTDYVSLGNFHPSSAAYCVVMGDDDRTSSIENLPGNSSRRGSHVAFFTGKTGKEKTQDRIAFMGGYDWVSTHSQGDGYLPAGEFFFFNPRDNKWGVGERYGQDLGAGVNISILYTGRYAVHLRRCLSGLRSRAALLPAARREQNFKWRLRNGAFFQPKMRPVVVSRI